ncbi:hypothetical protein HPB50_000638 [Hyalomma asiaticum]|uniref:Uncharacterized protein n=1 Tax=Hyalomma asiaticum TaxID=266040 RepID=A0ACB7TD16_HYAAI|nr:hypothetical protein HPB50_000638 [Hyalomma asiaticum]
MPASAVVPPTYLSMRLRVASETPAAHARLTRVARDRGERQQLWRRRPRRRPGTGARGHRDADPSPPLRGASSCDSVIPPVILDKEFALNLAFIASDPHCRRN